jgi:hypothetical protein
VRFIIIGFVAGYWTSNLLWTLQQQAEVTNIHCDDHNPTIDQPNINTHSRTRTRTRTTGITTSAVHSKSDFTISSDPKIIHEPTVLINSELLSSSAVVQSPPDTDNHSENSYDYSSEESLKQAAPVVSTHEIIPVVTNTTQSKLKGNKTRKPPSPTWWKRRVPDLARIWHPRDPSTWCVTETEAMTPLMLHRGEPALGVLYIKSYKASSSTCEGVAWNIAHHVGRRRNQRLCKAYTRHEFANQRHHARRGTQSLLWSFMRYPSARDLSHVYHFEIGREQRAMDDQEIIHLIETRLKGRQTRYLVPKKGRALLWPRHELRKNATEVLLYLNQTVLQNYDFLGVTERMAESLAVMVLLWDLQPHDVVVLSSKRSGGYDDGGFNDTCTAIPKAPPPSPMVQEYFASRHSIWNADVLLYHVVNASLDLTIDQLGRERVETMAEHIQDLQRVAQEQCLDQANFPCSPEGTFQPELAADSCYVQDSGCGYKCVDQVLSEYIQK